MYLLRGIYFCRGVCLFVCLLWMIGKPWGYPSLPGRHTWGYTHTRDTHTPWGAHTWGHTPGVSHTPGGFTPNHTLVSLVAWGATHPFTALVALVTLVSLVAPGCFATSDTQPLYQAPDGMCAPPRHTILLISYIFQLLLSLWGPLRELLH